MRLNFVYHRNLVLSIIHVFIGILTWNSTCLLNSFRIVNPPVTNIVTQIIVAVNTNNTENAKILYISTS